MKPQPHHAHTVLAALIAAVLGYSVVSTPSATAESSAAPATKEASDSFVRPVFMETATAAKAPVRVAHGDILLFDDTGASRATATIQAVRNTEQADILLLDVGYSKRFLPGMVCQVRAATADAAKATAQIIIVETHTDRAAALVLDHAPGIPPAPGDKATLKLLDL